MSFQRAGSSDLITIPPLGSVTLTAVDPGKLTVGSAVASASREIGGLRGENGQIVPGGSYVIEDFPAGGHLAKFINELFTQASVENFAGTLVVQSVGGPVAAVALELGSKPGESTTLPVVPLKD